MTDDEKRTERRIPVASLEPGSVDAAVADVLRRSVIAFSPVFDALGEAARQLGESWHAVQQESECPRG